MLIIAWADAQEESTETLELRQTGPRGHPATTTSGEAGLRRLKEPAGCPLGVGLCHPLPRVYPPGTDFAMALTPED
jgi:hypothetical protein